MEDKIHIMQSKNRNREGGEEDFYCDRKRGRVQPATCHEDYVNANSEINPQAVGRRAGRNVCYQCFTGKIRREDYSGFNPEMKRYDKSGRADAPAALGENSVDDKENTDKENTDDDDDDDI